MRRQSPTSRIPLIHSISFHALVHGYRRSSTLLKIEMLSFSLCGFIFKMDGGRFLREYQRRPSRKLRVKKKIICRHRIPYDIVTDNGSQFISDRFKELCERWKIRLKKSSPRYPGIRRRLLPKREDLNNTMLLGDLDLVNERRDQHSYESKTTSMEP